jgi:hypothetical protein
LVLLLDFFHVLLVLYLQLVEVDEFELIAHFFLFRDQVGCFGDLSREGALLVLVLFDQRFFLSVFFLKVTLDPFGFDVSSATVLASHEDLSLKIVGVFSDFSDGHVSFFEDCLGYVRITLRVSRMASDLILPFSIVSFKASASCCAI